MYKAYDRDGSGVIGADELPGAFRAAGEDTFHVLRYLDLCKVIQNMQAMAYWYM